MEFKLNYYFFLFLLLFSCQSDSNKKALEAIQKGSEFLNNRNYPSALLEFRNALKFELDEEQKTINYRNIAVTFLYLEQEDSAKYYSKIGMKSAQKNSFYFHLHQAEFFLLNKQIKQAIETFQKADKVKPNEMEIHNNLSLIYSGNYGDEFLDLNKALIHAMKACELTKNEINQEQLGSVYFQKENFKAAANIFLELKTKHPESKIYQFYYGQSLYFQGEEDKGLELMEDAANRDEKCRILFEQLIS